MEIVLGPFDLPKKDHFPLILVPRNKTAKYEDMGYFMDEENFFKTLRSFVAFDVGVMTRGPGYTRRGPGSGSRKNFSRGPGSRSNLASGVLTPRG